MASKPVITLELARRVIVAAEEAAHADDRTMCIAVVDDGGHLVSLARLDGTQLGSVEVAIEKARTAVMFKRLTKAIQEALEDGLLAALSLPGAVAIEGGVPITVDGELVGAVGVSGGRPQEDGVVAAAGASVSE